MNKFGFFYYSQKREDMWERNQISHSKNYFKTLAGKVKRYNSWASSFPFLSRSKWDDERLVGVGWYDHSDVA